MTSNTLLKDFIESEIDQKLPECRFCGSGQIIYLPRAGDNYCEECGLWQEG